MMLGLFIYEFKFLFRRLRTLFCLSLFSLCIGVFSLVLNFIMGSGEIYLLLALMSIAAALIIPVCACGSFAKGKDEGREKLISVLPYTSVQTVYAKVLALFAFFMIPTLVLFALPIVLASVSGVSVGAAYPAVILFVLWELMLIGFSVFASVCTKKLWHALLSVYAVLAAAFGIGFLGSFFADPWKRMLQLFAPNFTLSSASIGLFDIASLLLYASLAVAFTVLSVIKLSSKRKEGERLKKKGAPIRIKSKCVAAAAVCFCMGLSVGITLLPANVNMLDVSQKRIYAVSDEADDILSKIDEPLNLYLLGDGGNSQVGYYLRRYCAQYKNLTFKEIDVTKEPEFLNEYGLKADDIQLYSILVEGEKRHKLVNHSDCFGYYIANMGHMGSAEFQYMYQYYAALYNAAVQSNATQQISTLQTYIAQMQSASSTFSAESAITEAVAYVSAEYVPQIYNATGHGEKKASDNPLDLTKADKIPVDASLILINSPTSDYSAQEAEMLIDFMDEGGRVLLLTNKDNLKMDNLMSVAEHCGLYASDSFKEDEVDATVVSSTMLSYVGAESVKLNNAYEIKIDPDSKNSFTSLLKVEDKNNSDSSSAKNVAVMASDESGDEPKLIWIAASDLFNKLASDFEDDEDGFKNFRSAITLLSVSSTMLKEVYSSGASYPAPKVYQIAPDALNVGFSVFFCIVIVGILPLTLFCAPLFNRYLRRRRGNTNIK